MFHYLGPAFAVLLFVRVEPLGVAWLRIVSAAIVFAVWRRPWRSLPRLDRSTLRLLVALGLVLAVMNTCFYLAIDRLALGTVAAIEFLPVIVLAALGVRSLRNGLALSLAVAGVYVLVDVRLGAEPVGLALAFVNAGLFALYIVLAHRLSRSPAIGRIDGLALAMLVAAAAIVPFGAASVAPALLDPVALAAGVGVGIASSSRPVRPRPARDGTSAARDVLAHGVAAARDGDRDRDRRPGQVLLDRGARVALVVAAVALHRGHGAEKASAVRGPTSSMLLRFPRPARASPVRALPRFPYPFVSR